MGWQFNIEKFFQTINTDDGITKTLLFGAYSDNAPSQKKWADTLKETYNSRENFQIYFKTTRLKGEKIKGNLDSEIVYEILSQKSNFDTLILFSGDGDFAYIAEKLVIEHSKNVFIMSISSFTGAELYELERRINNENKFKIFDINSGEESTIKFLKQIVRGRLVLFPSLIEYYKGLDENGRKKNIQLIQDLIDGNFKNQKLFETDLDPMISSFLKLKNKNDEFIFPIIKTWKREDKERLIYYIKTL